VPAEALSAAGGGFEDTGNPVLVEVSPFPSGRGGGGVGLPSIEIVDLARELREGNRGIFSRALEAALDETLECGEQAMLFLNRRGSAGFVLCRDCGFVPRCSGCAVPYTVHANNERLRCHQCNRQRRMPGSCLTCGGARMRLFGLGTQRVEAEVRQRYPDARVVRWDRDAARTATDHAGIYSMLSSGEADVVVGTQMLAKGHDLPNVTLVGVVSADIALHMPDYRSGERAFQLLTQVAGRAGRGTKPGRVIIQTYTPDHYAIRATAAHDYRAMFDAEMRVRREAGYPPFGRLARLLFAHTSATYAEEEARRLGEELRHARTVRGDAGVDVLGPAPAFHARIRGRWRWQIVLRGHEPGALMSGITLRKGWTVEIDPVSLI
jgi:primosomal protein N' (replication factor Y)